MEENKKLIDIPILYEDENCVFINKPAGISVHGDGKTAEYTIADWVLEKYPETINVGEDIETRIKNQDVRIKKPGIVHRLDKETTGVMLIAKNKEAYEFFKNQFQDRETKKVYHAFVYGWPKEDLIHIDKPIGRDSSNIRRWVVGKFARGTMREAVTDVSVISRFGWIKGKPAQNLVYSGKGSTEEDTFSFVEARPKTGRTHQIRVHLRSINHPIVGDTLYAPKRKMELGFTRFALHARSLSVYLQSGVEKEVIAPYPLDFENALKFAKVI